MAATSKPRRARRGAVRRWSRQVTERSNALDLEPDVFTQKSPRAIAASLRRSAEASPRSFQSAMSMLTFYANRAGKRLPAARRRVLEQAKVELRRLFNRA